MPDRPHAPERDIERELRELGARIEHPPTPDLARAVRARLEETAPPASRGGFWSRLPHSRWAVAAALALVFLVPALSPAVRDTVGGWFVAGQSADGGAQSAGGEIREAEEPPSPAMPEAGGDVPSSAGSAPEAAGGGPGVAGDEAGDFDRKVIKTAELGIRSRDVRGSAAEAQRIAARFGGSVLSSEVGRDGGSVSADLVLSVPSPEFEPALDELRGIGAEVTTDSVRGEDVTEEFVDLQSRERNLLATEESLIGLYEKSENVNDTLRIQRELTRVRGEIEQVQGRIEYLKNRTATSRIDLSIRPMEDAAAPGWDPAGIAARAWNASLAVLQTLATAVISVLVFGWWLAPALVAVFVWWRRRSRTSTPTATGS